MGILFGPNKIIISLKIQKTKKSDIDYLTCVTYRVNFPANI